ncbi:SdrD B-like domain-containing protein, partial [Anaerolineales bacterium HSG24]|nr:SdrD B-like domain-containing protein [Anaerolineales bacterium HSG24]
FSVQRSFMIFMAIALIAVIVGLTGANVVASGEEWANTANTYNPGARKDGLDISSSYSDPQTVVGEAEGLEFGDGSYGDYWAISSSNQPKTWSMSAALGFGGDIILSFRHQIVNGEGADIEVIEASLGETLESADVYVGMELAGPYIKAGSLTGDGTIDLPAEVPTACYIKIVDTSNVDDFNKGSSDGYDVNGVRAFNTNDQECNVARLLMRDNSEDIGIEPNPSERGLWKTPDVWLRYELDGYEQSQNPIPGQTVYFYTRVQNNSSVPQTDVEIDLKWSRSNLFPEWENASRIGVLDVGNLAPYESKIVTIPWNVPFFANASPHMCFKAVATSNEKQYYVNKIPDASNVVQRNSNIVAPCDNTQAMPVQDSVTFDVSIPNEVDGSTQIDTVDIVVSQWYVSQRTQHVKLYLGDLFDTWTVQVVRSDKNSSEGEPYDMSIETNDDGERFITIPAEYGKLFYLKNLPLEANNNVQIDMDVVSIPDSDKAKSSDVTLSLVVNDTWVGSNYYSIGCTEGEEPELPYGSIGDTVWRDLEKDGGDGVQDEGEPGIDGVLVNLYEDMNSKDGAFNPAVDQFVTSVTTDANGNYLFAPINYGRYFVQLDASNFAEGGKLADFERSPTDVGGSSQDAVDSDALDDNNATVRISIWSTSRHQLTWDFGFYENGTTEITLDQFVAEDQGNQVKLLWITATEIDNAGFNLYRADSEDGPRTKVNGDMIGASAENGTGAIYRLMDTDPSQFYWLEDVDYNGTITLHGPFPIEVIDPIE